MIQTIITEPNPILRQRSEEVALADISSQELQRLVDDLIQTMYSAFGIGIAAPQIGISKRVIIIESGEKGEQNPLPLINPEIISKSWRKVKSEEGCLSLPGMSGIVKRHRGVEVRAQTREGKQINIKNKKLMAVILQHEIDHLNGVLFIDKAEEIHPVTLHKNPRI